MNVHIRKIGAKEYRVSIDGVETAVVRYEGLFTWQAYGLHGRSFGRLAAGSSHNRCIGNLVSLFAHHFDDNRPRNPQKTA